LSVNQVFANKNKSLNSQNPSLDNSINQCKIELITTDFCNKLNKRVRLILKVGRQLILKMYKYVGGEGYGETGQWQYSYYIALG